MKRVKSIINIILVSLVLTGCTTNFVEAEKPTPEVQQVFEFEDSNKQDLFAKTQLWSSNTFVSAKSAIELTNPDSGVVIIRTGLKSTSYEFGTALGGKYYITYKIVVELKDNKARITCKNPMYEVTINGTHSQMPSVSTDMVKEYTDHAENVISSFDQFMNEESGSDW